jgi:[acyl-carrier-protein] S-malonyltransferase
MGYDLCCALPPVEALFKEADSVLGFPLSKLCFEGPEEVLRQTVNAQPAIFVTSLAYLKVMPELWDEAEFASPSFVAGHSLGEYTALVAAKALDFADGLRLAWERGRLMQEAGERAPGGMVAIIGLDETRVEEVCLASGAQIANINSPEQIVVSVSREALASAAGLAKEKGARRVIPLEVSGAFHSPLMQPVVEGMSKAISGLTFNDPSFPIVANTTAQPISSTAEIKAELLNQICCCIQWQRSVEFMIDAGVSTFIEIGPGRVLTGLIKRIDDRVRVISTDGRR